MCIGSGIGGLPLIEETHDARTPQGGPRKISPFFVPGSIINMIAGQLSIKYGYKGPNLAIVTACTTANHCIGEAARLIEYGDADVMVAGGAEVDREPARRRRLLRRARAVDAQRRSGNARAGRGTRTATASCSARAPACWCSRSTSTRRRAARASTASSPATA